MIMRRRGFAAAWLFAALAQNRNPPVVGIIRPEPLPSPSYDAFQKALRDLGYVEGQTIVLEPRWPDGRQLDGYLVIAKEFVQRGVDIIVAGHSLSTLNGH
jgi:putative ABC transport system substrate-binding protein